MLEVLLYLPFEGGALAFWCDLKDGRQRRFEYIEHPLVQRGEGQAVEKWNYGPDWFE